MQLFLCSKQEAPGKLIGELIDTIQKRYKGDPNRIYITGLSLGGGGTWGAATTLSDKVAAIVPVAYGVSNTYEQSLRDNIIANKVAVWAHVGEHETGGVPDFIDKLNKAGANPSAKVTVHPGLWHNSWDAAYDKNLGGGNVYDWMLQFSKNGQVPNKSPIANAGENKTLTLPANTTTLTGSGSDPDGSISSYSWSKIEGGAAVLSNGGSPVLTVSELVAGTYKFRLTVTDNKGASAYSDAIVTVNPSNNGNGTGLRGEYFNDTNLGGTPVVRTDATINFNWGLSNPGVGFGNDNFSVRWTGKVLAPTSGTYTFYVNSDDGARLYVDNVELFNEWIDHGPSETSRTISLNGGQQYEIRLEYYERGGGALVELRWSGNGIEKQIIPSGNLFPATEVINNGNGLRGEYFNDINLGGTPVVRTDATVNFNWGSSNPGVGFGNDNFSVRWTGKVLAPTSGTYTFYVNSDDGARLYVDNVELFNEWIDHGPSETSRTISLNGGQQYDIRLEYYERGGGALVELRWSGNGIEKQIVPSGNLFSGSNFSSARKVMSSTSTSSSNVMTAYPVPATDLVNVQFNVAESGITEIKLLNTQHQLKVVKQNHSSVGLNTVVLDVKDLSEGLYVIKTTHNNKEETIKIIVKK